MKYSSRRLRQFVNSPARIARTPRGSPPPPQHPRDAVGSIIRPCPYGGVLSAIVPRNTLGPTVDEAPCSAREGVSGRQQQRFRQSHVAPHYPSARTTCCWPRAPQSGIGSSKRIGACPNVVAWWAWKVAWSYTLNGELIVRNPCWPAYVCTCTNAERFLRVRTCKQPCQASSPSLGSI
jgi:hypothetical protein